MRVRLIVFLLSLIPTLVHAGGYQGWLFGMSKEQVKAVGDPSRYYPFKNGDLGAGEVPFESGKALISFYFGEGELQRVMLIAYMGDDAGLARQAWGSAFAHLARACGEVESPPAHIGASTLEAVMAAYDRDVPALAAGQRHQMGCLHMPVTEKIWASATRGPGGFVMVSVNYGRP